jgi:acyl-CoA reductase-like NAD-dependent aldehyde dehydrogenase
VVNFITDANDLGDALTHHPDVRKISFTGSTTTGRKVMASAAETLKRITLELGGNDAGVVLDDAKPATVAKGIFDDAFQNSGQVCLAIKRLYVHKSIYDEMCNELAQLADAAIVDDGSKQGTQLCPLQKLPFKLYAVELSVN